MEHYNNSLDLHCLQNNVYLFIIYLYLHMQNTKTVKIHNTKIVINSAKKKRKQNVKTLTHAS